MLTMSIDVPPSLRPQAEFLRNYIRTGRSRTIFLAGSPGCGRGTVLKKVIAEEGYEPMYLDTPIEPPYEDANGAHPFPIYDLAKPQILPWKGVILIEDQKQLPKDKDPPQVMGFPRPPITELQDICRRRGWPVELTAHASTYADLMHAGRTWEVAHVITGRDLGAETAWADFHRGGPAPFEAPLFAFYAAYNLPPVDVRWNRDLGLLRRVRAPVQRLIWARLRQQMPQRPAFPAILHERKHKLGSAPKAAAQATEKAPAFTEHATVSVPANYSVDW